MAKVFEYIMPPYYETCVYFGYSLTTVFLVSFSAALGTMCAMYYTDVYPREKQIVQLQNNIELFEGELNIVREEESQEFERGQRLDEELERLREELLHTQGELERARVELQVVNRDYDICAAFTFFTIVVIAFYGIYRMKWSLGTSDRTEL